jgi:hypothetical protein
VEAHGRTGAEKNDKRGGLSMLRKLVLGLLLCTLVSVAGAYGGDGPADGDQNKKENSSASLTVVNKSRFPVIGVYLQPAREAARLATKGAPNVGKSVYSSEIDPGASATIKDIEPDDYVITIVKANGRGDIIRQDLKAGQVFTYAIE